jgi:hypothetical protein
VDFRVDQPKNYVFFMGFFSFSIKLIKKVYFELQLFVFTSRRGIQSKFRSLEERIFLSINFSSNLCFIILFEAVIQFFGSTQKSIIRQQIII